MEDSHWVWALGVPMVLMIVITVAGNVLVIAVICLNKKLRNRENVFVLSLAVSDLLVGALVMPLAVPKDLRGRWELGNFLCYLWVVVDITCSTSSIFSICALSFVRYLKIQKPYRYTIIVSKRAVAIALVVIWIVPTFATLFLYGKSAYQQGCGDQCDLRHSPDKLAEYSILSHFLPCMAMICLYYRLYVCCRRHLNHISVSYPYQRAWNNYKTVVTIGIIMTTFLVCWMPAQVMLIFNIIYKKVPTDLYKVFTWLGYSNSMLDPIVYSLLNKEFRKSFRVSLRLYKR